MQTIDALSIGRSTSALSVTACLRCRDQKLKCERERPRCTRCTRLNATCLYPEPRSRRGQRAKRKQLARQESTPHADCTSGSHPVSGPSFSNSPGPTTGDTTVTLGPANISNASSTFSRDGFVLSTSYAAQLHGMRAAATDLAFNVEQSALPSTAIGLSLLEIYFSRIYNASLLFFKPLLFQQYLAGEIHGALLKALFALATLFLRPRCNTSKRLKDGNEELHLLSVYHAYGRPWAKAALTEVTPLAVECPSLMTVRALQCLQLFWFGIALAYRSCQVLGFNKKVATEDNESDKSVEFEFRRRCFWSCWISTCIVMQPVSCIESAWREVAMLPLPCSLSSGLSDSEIRFNQMMDEDWNSLAVRSPTGRTQLPTATGLLIKIVGVWAKVQLLCRNSSPAVGGDVKSIHDLSCLASSLFEEAVAIRNSTHANDKTPEVQMIFLLHDAIYHQSQIALHSLVVPVFSRVPAHLQTDTQTQKKSAEAVIRHAELFETLLKPYLYGRGDVSRLPPLVGYGAFVVATVFLSAEVCWHKQSDSELFARTEKGSCRLDAAVAISHLLDSLKIYWRALESPWEVLQEVLRKFHSTPIGTPEPTEPRDRQLVTNPENCHTTAASGAFNQTSGLVNGHQQPSGRNRSTRNGTEDRETWFTDHPTGNTSEGQAEIIPSGSFMHQFDMFPEGEWYSLSLLESGVEELAGLELSGLFQQGFGTFS